ncbi:sugar kinase [Spongiactinospora sp. TRM90649]|uniref:sugar kinase n=1 Tax=Spongiactinospora sp. TRM90649 TaxID=3031114 RepID=UPI0023F8785B|nr:sugar kinase [Spongiactinospora sp. TRM90649]MDF5754707.1 sugar kinase [Spongiactinospora sp. TRM90649]
MDPLHATSTGRTDVTTLGESLASLHGQGPLRLGGTLGLSVAGAEASVAIGLARLGHAVRWAGVVGDDEFGRLVLRTLRAEGVDVSTARVHGERPTGLLVQESRVADITRVHYYRAGSAGATLSAADATAALAEQPRVLHITGVTPALGAEPRAAMEHAVRLAKDAGVMVSLDVKHRSRLWDADTATSALSRLLPFVDVLIVSAGELPLVGGPEGVTGIAEVVVKHGADGAEAWRGAEHARAAARRVPVAGTVGAGDAFTAGYLSGLLDGLPLPGRLARGVTLAAFAVASHSGRQGGWHGLPTRDELHLLDLPEGATVR